MRPLELARAGWMEDVTNWLAEQLQSLWSAIVEFFNDYLVMAVESICEFFATAIESIPVPEFFTTYSMNALLADAGPTIGWLIGNFRIGECLGIIAAGYAFRLLRKLFTLGQW